MRKIKKSLQYSSAIHILLLSAVFVFIHFKKPFSELSEFKIDVSLIDAPLTGTSSEVASTLKVNRAANIKTTASALPKNPKNKSVLDFRPAFMKRPIYASESVRAESSDQSRIDAPALITTEPRIANAFEHLAFTINRELEYPDLLFQHGVQGFAVFDLKFDQDGNVDEDASSFKGSHFALRGLLSHAARLAIVEWYRSDAYRLRKSEFRGQHFHAEFEISYTEENKSSLLKSGSDSYQMIRRKKKFECAHINGVDVACLAAKTTGLISNILSDTSNINFRMLMEKISQYDDAGIRGVNHLIHGS